MNYTQYIFGMHLSGLYWQIIRSKSLISILVGKDISSHDDVIEWKHFPRYCTFVLGIHQSLANSPHKGQWRGALIFSLICAWINGWVNNRDAGNLRRHRAHYDVIVMWWMCNYLEDGTTSVGINRLHLIQRHVGGIDNELSTAHNWDVKRIERRQSMTTLLLIQFQWD